MENGFSARTIDTKYITPTLKELKLPSMAESGWLTRSLEQPYPYTMKYKGGISGKGMKEAFLKIVDYAQNEEKFVIPILRIILNSAIYIREQNKVEIKKIETDDSIHISKIIDLLDTHFNYKYSTHGGSKLPALAFYSMYEILLSEISRFKDYELLPLGSHTASDRTSKSAGDIEVGKDGKIYEAVEIKLDKEIDITAARIAFEKIARFNTERYYILSYIGTKKEDVEDINALILEIRDTHGCQLIVNGLLRTLRYYLRLISSPDLFLNKYINLVINDKELKKIHKTKLEELLSNI
jgi:DNA (cytosine-5)-methyltransferase 1